MTEPFDQFWGAYPRRVGKGQARRAYAAALKKASHETIMSGLERYKRYAATLDPKFVCHPSTWLNGERWEDELPEPPKGEAPLPPDEAAAVERRWAERVERGEAVPDGIIRNLIRKGMVSAEQKRIRGY